MLLLTLISIAMAQTPGDFRWLVADTPLKRFSDADEVSTTLKAETRVEVIAVGEALIRVRAGRDFGWVTPDALTATLPTSD